MRENSKNDNFLVKKKKNLLENAAVLHLEQLLTLFRVGRGRQIGPQPVFCL